MKTQPHEANRVLAEMYEMMDTINMIPAPGDPDHHFAMMMTIHHEGAINMANVVLNEGHDPAIKRMAHFLIQKLSREIAELKAFLSSHLPGAVNQEFNMKMEMSIDKMDSHPHLQSVNGNIDHDFATLMLSHHRSAIDMADLVVQYGHDHAIMNLAREIKDDQETEIAQFQMWLAHYKY